MTIPSALLSDLSEIRKKSPVVFNITNAVAMDFTANALLALGASPVMAHAEEELDDMVGIASALVLNIGTPDARQVSAMSRALGVAHRRKIPAVLDPVGAGATRFRTEAARKLYEQPGLTAVRANASEMLALLGAAGGTRGVDSAASPEAVHERAQAESRRNGITLVVSGPTDYVFHAGLVETVSLGDPMMTKVTAMGCVSSSLLGAFLTVSPAPKAAQHTMFVMGLCGERARAKARGPGSFRTAFLDELAAIGAA